MFISYNGGVGGDFLKWSRSQAKKNSNDNDQPGGSTPLSLVHPLTGDPDASEGCKRARSV